MSATLELRSQFTIIVDLAVEYDGDCLVFIEGGLFAREQIDDCEAPHSQGDASRNQKAFRIRTTMRHPLAHCVEQLLCTIEGWRSRIKIGPTGYAAHCVVNRE